MRIGTTPTHTYKLPLPVSTYDNIRVIYSQDGREILSKEKSEAAAIDGNSISFKLTESETFMFRPDKMVEIQVRIKASDGTVDSSNIISTTAQRCLDSEVM